MTKREAAAVFCLVFSLVLCIFFHFYILDTGEKMLFYVDEIIESRENNIEYNSHKEELFTLWDKRKNLFGTALSPEKAQETERYFLLIKAGDEELFYELKAELSLIMESEKFSLNNIF